MKADQTYTLYLTLDAAEVGTRESITDAVEALGPELVGAKTHDDGSVMLIFETPDEAEADAAFLMVAEAKE